MPRTNQLTRRTLLKSGVAAGLAAGTSPLFSMAPARSQEKTLCILGGTGFLGPKVVEAAKAAGYKITLFNRGKTNPGMFPDLEKLRGDRNTGDLKGMSLAKWNHVLAVNLTGPFLCTRAVLDDMLDRAATFVREVDGR